VYLHRVRTVSGRTRKGRGSETHVPTSSMFTESVCSLLGYMQMPAPSAAGMIWMTVAVLFA
jgi:hypothetical protein